MARRQVWILGGGTLVAGAAVALWLALSAREAPVAGPLSLIPLAAAPTRAPAEAPPTAANLPEAPAELALPAFDVVRLSLDGEALVAGQGAPGAAITLRVDGAVVAEAAADSSGQFVAMFSLGFSETLQVMTLEMADAGGAVVQSPDTVMLTPRPAPPTEPLIVASVEEAQRPVEALADTAAATVTEPTVELAALSGGAAGSSEFILVPPESVSVPAQEPVILTPEAPTTVRETGATAEAPVSADAVQGGAADEPAVQATLAGSGDGSVVQVTEAQGGAADEPVVQATLAGSGDGSVVQVTEASREGSGGAAVARLATEASGVTAATGLLVPGSAGGSATQDVPGVETFAVQPADGLRSPGLVAPGAVAVVGDVVPETEPESGPESGPEPALDALANAAPAAAETPRGDEAGPLAAEPDADPAPAVPRAPALVADAGAAPTAILLRGDGSVAVLDRAPRVMDNVVIDAITYSEAGDVQISGRAAGADPSGNLRIYLDNRPIALARAEQGDWALDLPTVDAGIYTLRVDQLNAEGGVVSRFETPFLRESPQTLAAVRARTDAGQPAQTVVASETAPESASDVSSGSAGTETTPARSVDVASRVPNEPVATVPAPSTRAPTGAVSAAVSPNTAAQPMTSTAPAEPVLQPATAPAATDAGLPTTPVAAVATRAAAAASAAPPAAPRASLITVQPGHTLWAISRDRYGQGERYMIIFNANRSQIRDPDLIYPGQVFALPDAGAGN